MPNGYEEMSGTMVDLSTHEESVTPVQTRGYGRGASTRDAADRGATRAPMDQPMPVSPSGNLPYGSYDK